MNLPLASIIITSYNKSKYILSSISSAEKQTYPNKEIIVIDDSSTDDTKSILSSYIKGKNINFIHLQENQGVVYCRNYAISRAKGKYILPLDGDDIIAPTYLEEAIVYLESHQNCGICYCLARKFKHEGTKTYEWNLPPFSLKQMFVSNCIFSSAIFKKKDWSQSNGYDKDFNFGYEDWAFWLSILKLGREVHRIPKVLFYYRISSNERSASATAKTIEAYSLIYRKNSWAFSNNNITEDLGKNIADLLITKKQNKILRKKFKQALYLAFFLLLTIFVLMLDLNSA